MKSLWVKSIFLDESLGEKYVKEEFLGEESLSK